MSKTKKKFPPLNDAVVSQNIEKVKELINMGLDVNEADPDKRTPLIKSAIEGSYIIAKTLIEAGARTDAADNLGWSALHYAAQDFHLEIVELLISSGAPLEAEDEYGNTPLINAVFNSKGRGDVVTAFLKAGADPNHVNHYKQTPIGLAHLIVNYDVKQFF